MQIKYDGRFRRFNYRGSRLTGAEFAIVAIAHNIRKMASLLDVERSSLDVELHPEKKKATNNHLFVAFFVYSH